MKERFNMLANPFNCNIFYLLKLHKQADAILEFMIANSADTHGRIRKVVLTTFFSLCF